MQNNNIIKIYVDGACEGNPGPGGWGMYVVFYDQEGNIQNAYSEKGSNEDDKSIKTTTNNRMELLAAIKAMEYIKKHNIQEVTIYSDSQYFCRGINEWLLGWEKNGRLSEKHKDPVKNIDLWTIILNYKKYFIDQGVLCTFEWIKGHSAAKNKDSKWVKNNIIGNNMADKLANEGKNEAINTK